MTLHSNMDETATMVSNGNWSPRKCIYVCMCWLLFNQIQKGRQIHPWWQSQNTNHLWWGHYWGQKRERFSRGWKNSVLWVQEYKTCTSSSNYIINRWVLSLCINYTTPERVKKKKKSSLRSLTLAGLWGIWIFYNLCNENPWRLWELALKYNMSTDKKANKLKANQCILKDSNLCPRVSESGFHPEVVVAQVANPTLQRPVWISHLSCSSHLHLHWSSIIHPFKPEAKESS